MMLIEYLINKTMLINIEFYDRIIVSVLKKKLFLPHNFEYEKNGKEKNRTRR